MKPAVEGADVLVVVLTFNSSGVIERTLKAARQVSPEILVVDSFSTDDTRKIATRHG